MFDEIESIIADSNLLLANKFSERCELCLEPYEKLKGGVIEKNVRVMVSYAWLQSQPTGLLAFSRYLAEQGLEYRHMFLLETSEYATLEPAERTAECGRIYCKFLKLNQIGLSRHGDLIVAAREQLELCSGQSFATPRLAPRSSTNRNATGSLKLTSARPPSPSPLLGSMGLAQCAYGGRMSVPALVPSCSPSVLTLNTHRVSVGSMIPVVNSVPNTPSSSIRLTRRRSSLLSMQRAYTNANFTINSAPMSPPPLNLNPMTPFAIHAETVRYCAADIFAPIVVVVRAELEMLASRFIDSAQYQLFVQWKAYCQQSVGLVHFETFRVLGRGSFGTVRAVRKRDTGRMFAMKVISKGMIKERHYKQLCLNERNVLVTMASSEHGCINQPTINGNAKSVGVLHSSAKVAPSGHSVLSLKYAFQDTRNAYLVMRYCPGGDLDWHLRSAGCFNEERARFCMAEVLLGLERLHTANIVYRDLKPANLLLTEEGHCVISDLGLAKYVAVGVEITDATGTPGFWAPEVAQRKPQNATIDFWSFGVTLYYLMHRELPRVQRDLDQMQWSPFSHDDADELVAKAGGRVQIEVAYPVHFSEPLVDLLKKLFVLDPACRLGAGGVGEIKSHAFFTAINWTQLACSRVTPPFVPSNDAVNAESSTEPVDPFADADPWTQQQDSEFGAAFDFVSEQACQREIVEALMDARERMPVSNYQQAQCCTIL